MAFVLPSGAYSGACVSRTGAVALRSPIRQVSAFARPSRRVYAPGFVRMSTASTSKYEFEKKGDQSTKEFRIVYKENGNVISPWHSIPLYVDEAKGIVNYVNEIPKGTSAKMEIATDEPNTPIKQDIKKGDLRFYKYGDSLVNYGALPQTWEDPGETSPDTGLGGDNDPVDAMDLSDIVMPMGAVYQLKVLGVLGLLDEGETDWKILAINVDDPNADKINSVEDCEKVFPGKVHEVREWFRLYKTAEGKGENEYAFGGEAKDKAYALKVLKATHESWKNLKSGAIANEDDLWLS